MPKKVKYDFIAFQDYDYADKKIPHIIEVPEEYKPFSVSRWPVAGNGMEFWFVREHITKKRIPALTPRTSAPKPRGIDDFIRVRQRAYRWRKRLSELLRQH